MKLSLGPLPFYWDRESVFQFYDRICSTPVDIVYLGETVCGKRHALKLPDWIAIGERLARAGKEVILSTLALIEAESELATLQRICSNDQFEVEANDMAAVQALTKMQRPFVGGPHLNIYNPDALAILAAAGARRWTMPVEMAATTLAGIQQARPNGMATEVFALGRAPLAFSARCFTARAHDRGKDECGFICAQYPNGMPLDTQEDVPFLVLNGIQTLSASIYSLIEHLDEMAWLGVDVIRLSPIHEEMADIIDVLHAVLAGSCSVPKALGCIHDRLPDKPNNGYWRGRPGIEEFC